MSVVLSVSSSQFVRVISLDERSFQVAHGMLTGVLPFLVVSCIVGSSLLVCSRKHRLSPQVVPPTPATVTSGPETQLTPTPLAVPVPRNEAIQNSFKEGTVSRIRIVDAHTKTIDVVDVVQPGKGQCDIVPSKGNLDEMATERKADWEKQLALMGSKHEMEETAQNNAKGHVNFKKSRCKLFETNDVLTAETRRSSDESGGSGSAKESPAKGGDEEDKEKSQNEKSQRSAKKGTPKEEEARSDSDAAGSAGSERPTVSPTTTTPTPTPDNKDTEKKTNDPKRQSQLPSSSGQKTSEKAFKADARDEGSVLLYR